MATKSLLARNNDIANTARQLDILSNGIFASGELPTFVTKIKETNHSAFLSPLDAPAPR